MKIFIFGAGASLGSQGDSLVSGSELRSPLVNEIFTQQYETYYGNILSSDEFLECADEVVKFGSLEGWLTSRWENIQKLKVDKTKIAERAFFGRITFYIWKLMQGVSNSYTVKNGYSLLLRKLKLRDESFGLISFNYDTLLDRAYESIYGISLNSLEAYIASGFIKPHGSVNWLLQPRLDDPEFPKEISQDIQSRLRHSSSSMFNKALITSAGSVIYNPNHGDLDSLSNLYHRFGSKYFYPLILIPLTVKLFSFFEDFYKWVIQEGSKLLSEADEIYIIGYRAEDDLIKELFNFVKAGTKLHVVDFQGGASSTFNRVTSWKTDLAKGNMHEDGFWPFVERY